MLAWYWADYDRPCRFAGQDEPPKHAGRRGEHSPRRRHGRRRLAGRCRVSRLSADQMQSRRRCTIRPARLPKPDKLMLDFSSYIVDMPGCLVLIDCGIGNGKERPDRPLWHRRNGDFLSRIARARICARGFRHRHQHASACRSRRMEHDRRWRRMEARFSECALRRAADRARP